MPVYYVTVTQKQDITYRVEASDETEASNAVSTADIETLDGWETHNETYGAEITNTEEVDA